MRRTAKLNGVVAGGLTLVIFFMGTSYLTGSDENTRVPANPPAKTHRSSVNFQYVMGLAHGTLGNYEASRRQFARIRDIDPASPLGYGPAGRTYLAEGHLDQALFWFSAAQAVNPGELEHAGWMVLLYDCLGDYDAAGLWSGWLDRRITNQPMPMAVQAMHHYLSGDFELALQYSNLALKFDFPNRWNSDAVFMRIKRDEALAGGDPDTGIGLFAAHYPELFLESPVISAENITQATDLALLLKIAGRPEETRRLLDSVLIAYDQPFLAGGMQRSELLPLKAEALAILGDEPGSLAELNRVIDLGWRVPWRWKTDLNPNFNTVRQSAEFQSLVAKLEMNMAGQRALAENMAEHGEIARLPALDGLQ